MVKEAFGVTNILHEIPGFGEYAALRRAAGLRPADSSAAEAALSRSLFAVIARDGDGGLVGTGRIVGDGGCYFQIVDVIVHPDAANGPLRQALADELIGWLDRNAPKGAEVLVMADAPTIGLYKHYGFELTYPNLFGLHRTRRDA